MRDPEYCDERRLERRFADVLVVPGIKNIKFRLGYDNQISSHHQLT